MDAAPGVEVAACGLVATSTHDRVIELARRSRRARRENQVLLVAVIACNVAYGIASLIRGPNPFAWLGIVAASVAAHVTAWRVRRYQRGLEREIRAWMSVTRVTP